MQWTTFVWMFLVLKIPIAALLWLVWYAIHAEPEGADSSSDENGGGPGLDPRPKPRRPIGPRRGDHPAPTPAPARVRLKSRELTPRHEREA